MWLSPQKITITEDEVRELSTDDRNSVHEDPDIWKKANKLVSSGEGSTGVFILSTPEGSIVLKSAQSIGQEYYSSVLAQVLRAKCPLPEELLDFPKMRIFGFADDQSDEWGTVKMKLSQLAIGSPGLHIKVEKELNRPFFLVQEFVQGQDLPSLGPQRLGALFTPSPANLSNPLRQLGWLMAFDMLINNFDRLPLVWDNDGNLANIYLRHQIGDKPQIVGIDQAVTTIDPSVSPKGVENYLKKLEQFLDPLIESPTMLHTRLLKVQDSLLVWSGFQLPHDQILALQFFILEAVASLGKSLSREVFQETKSFVQHRMTYDWQDIWGNMMKLINIDFLEKVLKVFQDRVELIDKRLSLYTFPYYPPCSCKACSEKRTE